MRRVLAIVACLSWQMSAAAIMPRVAASPDAAPKPCCCCASSQSCPCGCEKPAKSSSRFPIEFVTCPCDVDATILQTVGAVHDISLRALDCASSPGGVKDADTVLVIKQLQLSYHGPPPELPAISSTILLI